MIRPFQLATGTRCLVLGVLVGLAMSTSGCGSFFSSCHDCPPPPPADNSGSWSGSLEVPSLASGGNIDMAMVQTGSRIQSARLQISSLIGPPDCGISGSMTGSIDGSNITMTITENTGDVLNLVGTIGTGTMSGTYTSSGTCTAGISGSFSFGLIPSITSTQWTGSITSTATTSFTASLTEDHDANLTGTVQFAGTTCSNAIDVSGSVTGIQVYFQDTQGGSLLNAGGTMSSSDGKAITGTTGGSCAGGGGFTMSRP